MSQGSIRTAGWRRTFAILGLAVTFAVPASSSSREQDQKLQSDATSQVEVLEIDLGISGGPTQSPLAPTGLFIDEVEPNETTATAQPLGTLPVRLRGNLYKTPRVGSTFDNDFFSFTAPAGARLYAATMTGGSGGSTDTIIEVYDVNGTTILESDDEDGGVSASASNVAGTVLATGGTYYLRVRPFSAAPTLSSTIRPYDVYVALQTGVPAAEVEPNNNGAPNVLPANGWVSGAIATAGDNDTFSFSANAGDTIVAILDVDPERDAPEWNARLAIGAFNNFLLLINGSAVGGTFDDANPSEALFMTTNTTGQHVIYIDEGSTVPVGGPGFTYNLTVVVIPARPKNNCTTYVGTSGPIGDLTTTTFTIPVADAGLIDYMRLNLSATHTATADLDVTLVSPDNNEVFLFDDLATTATATAPQINFTLEDEAGIPAGVFGVHSGMRYMPEAAGRFAYFKGMERQGTWTLRVRDDLTANTGTVNSLSLEVCAPEPRLACLVPGPLENTVYTTDFEATDGGFTHTGTLDEWERGLPASGPITTAHSGVNAWKTDLDSNYENSSNQDLISPSIDLTSLTGRITLNWWHKFQFESASFDSYWVEVQQVGNPASARTVFEWTGATMTRGVGSPSVTIAQSAGWGRVQADISAFAGQMVEVRFHVQTDSSGAFPGVAVDDVLVTSCTTLTGALPVALSVDAGGNGVYQPNETVTVEPSWMNTGVAAVALSGTLTNHTGPAGATYTIPDSTASYGTLAVGATASCTSTSDCYTVANTVTTRPVTHWDSTALETVTSAPAGSKNWVLHIGDSFPDVPPGNSFYRFVETIFHNGVTAGCNPTSYCPNGFTTREQMAVFVLVSKAPGAPAPVACVAGSETFTDVPATSPFCRWIEELARRGVVAGCGGSSYCPQASATREEMAVFVLRTLDPVINPPACVAGSETFADVPASSNFCRWIEELARRGVVTGCGNGNYCPTAAVTREQMAVFLAVTFGLVLYGI